MIANPIESLIAAEQLKMAPGPNLARLLEIFNRKRVPMLAAHQRMTCHLAYYILSLLALEDGKCSSADIPLEKADRPLLYSAIAFGSSCAACRTPRYEAHDCGEVSVDPR